MTGKGCGRSESLIVIEKIRWKNNQPGPPVTNLES